MYQSDELGFRVGYMEDMIKSRAILQQIINLIKINKVDNGRIYVGINVWNTIFKGFYPRDWEKNAVKKLKTNYVRNTMLIKDLNLEPNIIKINGVHIEVK